MRQILDQHAKRLTSQERRAIWEEISGSRAEQSRATVRWSLSATVATVAVAVAVLTIAVLERGPVAPRHTSTLGPVEVPSDVAGRPVPAKDRLQPEADRRAPIDRPSARPVTVEPPAEHRVEHVPSTATIEAGVAIEPKSTKSLSAPTVPSPPNSGSMGAVTGWITDSQGLPVAYANVTIPGTRQGTMSGDDGSFGITGLPPGTYSLVVQAIGYEKQLREGIVVEGGQTVPADIHLDAPKVVKAIEEIEVRAERRTDTKSSSSKQAISGEKLREIPVDNLREAVGLKAGVATKGDELHFRGGRSGEVKYQVDGLSVGPRSPPGMPTTGGTRRPNDVAVDSMFFMNYGVNPFIATDEDALSTFAVDVDAASYTVTRRYIELGQGPPADAVRVEEFVNFFPQGYPHFERDDFRILIDGAPSPFGPGYHLLRIGLKGREIVERNRKPAQLTFVIDVSGSMEREDRLELVKHALRLLVNQLHGNDRVGIVVYGTQGRVLLDPVALGGRVASAAGRRRILEAIEQLRPEGSTNAEHGLRLGYEMARRGYRPKALNRVVLCSDGVANVGRTGPESILAQVRTEADRGVQLTTIGFGMGNYNDVLMEQLADRGDGNYYYMDDIDEARRVLVENLTGTLQTIARDAKVQVEFDSTRVLRYRLIGFENRDVADRDFRNDKIDAGEVGAGHEVTALYEMKLAPQITQGTLATVRLRYARPEQDGTGASQVREIVQRFDATALSGRFEDAAPRFRLDAAVAEFAEILRGSYWAKESRLSDVLSVAQTAARNLRDDTTAGFVSLVQKAAALSERTKPGEGGEEQ
jgi:Ca-activated chloride channel family protein